MVWNGLHQLLRQAIEIILKIGIAVGGISVSVSRIAGIQSVGRFILVRHTIMVTVGQCGHRPERRPCIDGLRISRTMRITTLYIDDTPCPVTHVIHDALIESISFGAGTTGFGED